MGGLGAGDLTELIAVERLVRADDGGGGYFESWYVVAQMWAGAAWIRGGESDRQGAVRGAAVYRFTVQSEAVRAAAVSTADRIVWNGDPYNIREQPRRQAHAPMTDIIAETGVAQ